MNGNRLFVDTNILLYYLKGNEDVVELIVDKDLIISFITEIEILAFPNLAPNTLVQIKELFSLCTIMDLERGIKDLTIEIKIKYKLKIPDAIIAASAQYYNLPLITADKAFRKLKDQNIVFYEMDS